MQSISKDGKSLPASVWLLLAAILVYGLFGTPTPDHPGIVEIVIGALLAAASLLGIAARHAERRVGRSGFEKALQVFFVCGLIVPAFSGAWFDNDHGLMLRDVAAFLFLGLPLFLAGSFERGERETWFLAAALVFAGLAFCLRTLLPVFNIWVPERELLYLSNSPLAMFAGVFAALSGWRFLTTFTPISLLKAALCFGAVAVVAAAMLLDLQRATVGAIALSVIAMAAIDFARTPRRAALPLTIICLLIAVCYPLFQESAAALARKTSEVGFNMRLQEAAAVYDAVLLSPVSILAGRGWGSVFASPAVGGLDVNYTHSLLTMLFLKGGLLLLVPGVAVFVSGCATIIRMVRNDAARGLSCLWPFVIPCLLYASYKSLDFGLVLLMIVVWSNSSRSLAAPRPLV